MIRLPASPKQIKAAVKTVPRCNPKHRVPRATQMIISGRTELERAVFDFQLKISEILAECHYL